MKTTGNKAFELRVKSSTEQLATIRDFVKEKSDLFGVPGKITDAIILAVDEASTNIVKHAYHYNTEKEILISVVFENDSCTVILTDFGDPFDPDSVPNPDMKEYLEKRRVGGLGLMLMRTLMDYVEYNSIEGKSNTLTLVKKIQ